MAKFNTRDTRAAVTTTSPVATIAQSTPDTRTAEGGHGFTRDIKSELFLLAVANMVAEHTFYESADARDERFETLVRQVAITNPDWTLQFVRWLRGDANMRSASIVAAAEAVKARLDAGQLAAPPVTVRTAKASDKLVMEPVPQATNRSIVDASMLRADEPGEFLAYWTSRYGRKLPMPVKRGVADAVVRLYTERSLLKYDTAGQAWRFGDVIDLVHPRGTANGHPRDALYRHALDRRHGHDTEIPLALHTLAERAQLMALDLEERRDMLARPDVLERAGMTWEALSGWLQGPMDAAAWEAIIPSMGVMALARNLRNFDQAGVSDKVAAAVCAKFTDPETVARSRMFPFRWLAAYRHSPSLRWGHALDKALTLSLANVPALPGRTLILVDISGSMADKASGANSDMTRADVAKVFAAALALRAQHADLVWFNGASGAVKVPKGGSLLRLVEAIPAPYNGTDTRRAVATHYADHDRVVIVTDEQAHYTGTGRIDKPVPSERGFYTWNLAGYRVAHAPSGFGTRHTFGGLTDQAFRMIPLIEAGRDGVWPWREAATE